MSLSAVDESVLLAVWLLEHGYLTGGPAAVDPTLTTDGNATAITALTDWGYNPDNLDETQAAELVGRLRARNLSPSN